MSYSTTEVVRKTGVSFRRLDYWDTTGLVRPSIREAAGPGSQRRYSDEDVAQVALIARLQQAGVDLHVIRRRTPMGVVQDLRALLAELGEVVTQ